jgi:hypothetical protein
MGACSSVERVMVPSLRMTYGIILLLRHVGGFVTCNIELGTQVSSSTDHPEC